MSLKLDGRGTTTVVYAAAAAAAAASRGKIFKGQDAHWFTGAALQQCTSWLPLFMYAVDADQISRAAAA